MQQSNHAFLAVSAPSSRRAPLRRTATAALLPANTEEPGHGAGKRTIRMRPRLARGTDSRPRGSRATGGQGDKPPTVLNRTASRFSGTGRWGAFLSRNDLRTRSVAAVRRLWPYGNHVDRHPEGCCCSYSILAMPCRPAALPRRGDHPQKLAKPHNYAYN